MHGGVVAGVDWAKDDHQVLVLGSDGERIWSARIAHSESGIEQLCRGLLAAGVHRVAIERPDGLLVDRLLDAGLSVMPIHPNQLAASRARFRAAGGKSDRFDAFVLAELARTDQHRFRVLAPDSDQTKALRALTRGREMLVEQRVALCNQLRAELDRCWPGATQLFAALDSPISLAFLERYPSRADTRGLGEQRLARWLSRQNYSGCRTPSELLARLNAAPTGRAAELEANARRQIVLALVAALRPIVAQITTLTKHIAEAIHAHPDGQIFLSFFKDPNSVITAATLLAEIGDDRQRYPTPESLAADAGMTPVAVESGRRKVACFRRGCDHRLRRATCSLSDATRHWHPWAQDRYAAARARGQDHPRALRTVGRGWTRIIWRCWQDRTPYNPAIHNALQRQIGSQG